MEELVLDDKPGLLSRLTNLFTRPDDEFEDESMPGKGGSLQIRPARYTITVRRQVTSFDDAIAAANGLKRGEQQILNLAGTDTATKQKIVDFMCGVNFAQEGTWEEVGNDIYLIVPSSGYVEVVPPSPRMNAMRN
jgi:cell division inhibitor SepF